MIGFFCQSLTDLITVDKQEMDDVQWFDIQQLKDMLQKKSELVLPPQFAMANHLISIWINDFKRNKI